MQFLEGGGHLGQMPHPGSAIEHPLSSIHITSDIVFNKLSTLKSNKSPGPDGLHPLVLKEAAAQLCIPFSMLFRRSFDEGHLPDDWKTANIVPVFKKGVSSGPGNYRPISLTSIVCKVFESIVREDIIKHLTSNNLLSNSQHGFLPKRSCTTQLLTAMEHWTNEIQLGHPIDVLYFDFKKAFDKVPHERLLIKLKAHGITGKLLDWIRSFLQGRKQRVTFNGVKSSWGDVLSGVPQGSVLGPIFFVVYINDLPQVLTNHCLLFADDTKLYSCVTDDADICRMQ